MPDDRRNRATGGTYLFTASLPGRNSRLGVMHVNLLRDAVRDVRARAPFHIDAWAVLPDHMHCIWTLPPEDDDFSAAGAN